MKSLPIDGERRRIVTADANWHGVKVRLETGEVGRVKEVLGEG